MFSNFSIPLTVSQLIVSASYFHRLRQWAQLLLILFSLWISSWTSRLAPSYHSFLLYPKRCLWKYSAGSNRANQRCSGKMRHFEVMVFHHSAQHVLGSLCELTHLLIDLTSKHEPSWSQVNALCVYPHVPSPRSH